MHLAPTQSRQGTQPIRQTKRTAFYAGLGAWLLGYFLPLAMWMPMSLFPVSLMATVMMIGLLEILIATEAGAWVYREEDPLRGTAAQALKRAA